MEYFDELLRACGIAVLCVICIAVAGRLSDAAALALRLGGGVVLFGIMMLLLEENISSLKAALESVGGTDGSVHTAFSTMLKALGVALISKLCSDVCRDCGEGTIANGVDSVGRMAMIALCIPIISDILDFAADVLERGM